MCMNLIIYHNTYTLWNIRYYSTHLNLQQIPLRIFFACLAKTYLPYVEWEMRLGFPYQYAKNQLFILIYASSFVLVARKCIQKKNYRSSQASVYNKIGPHKYYGQKSNQNKISFVNNRWVYCKVYDLHNSKYNYHITCYCLWGLYHVLPMLLTHQKALAKCYDLLLITLKYLCKHVWSWQQ